jgi:hypothetical protein
MDNHQNLILREQSTEQPWARTAPVTERAERPQVSRRFVYQQATQGA